MKQALQELKVKIEQNISTYEKTEPIIYNFLDTLYIDIDENSRNITVSHLLLAEDIFEYDNNKWHTNQIYKLYESLNLDTTGLAGF